MKGREAHTVCIEYNREASYRISSLTRDTSRRPGEQSHQRQHAAARRCGCDCAGLAQRRRHPPYLGCGVSGVPWRMCPRWGTGR